METEDSLIKQLFIVTIKHFLYDWRFIGITHPIE